MHQAAYLLITACGEIDIEAIAGILLRLDDDRRAVEGIRENAGSCHLLADGVQRGEYREKQRKVQEMSSFFRFLLQ